MYSSSSGDLDILFATVDCLGFSRRLLLFGDPYHNIAHINLLVKNSSQKNGRNFILCPFETIVPDVEINTKKLLVTVIIFTTGFITLAS